MIARLGRATGRRRRWSWTQCTGAVVAVVASLAALSLPGAARAATNNYDQMTGVGSTASAVTVDWTKGLLDNTNTAITGATGPGSNGDRTNQSSALWFMYQDFQTLSVKVSQTQDIGHQGITVSWTWTGKQTIQPNGLPYGYFLQMMECYGDASTGPTPEQCQYGSKHLLANGTPPGIGERNGDLCASSTPSVTNPPRSKDGTGAAVGCDPAEPGSSPTDHTAPCPGTFCNPDGFDIPFDPVTDTNGTQLDYGIGDTTYYNEFNTNEVQQAVTGSSGTGQQQFETLTGIQAPGLGCGQAESGGSPRGCWLVIVPRGEYEPNGYDQINAAIPSLDNPLNSSPLSASNWAQRIQIHLSYAPVGAFCAAGTPEFQTFGTQMITRAMQSWQLSLNQTGGCKEAYAYSAVTEQQSTLNETASGDVGLSFTTIPIGSETTRSGGSPPANLPTILYAPVAVAALDFGFNIDIGLGGGGQYTTPVRLTPLLVAKAVTQSYLDDVPDYYPQGGVNAAGALLYPGPTWVRGNPENITADPTFAALNTGIPGTSVGPINPLLTEDHTAFNQQIWHWIQSSSAATTWLGGAKDTNDGNMQVDPAYDSQTLNVGTNTQLDSFPRAYPTCLDLGLSTGTSPKEEQKCSLDLLPYTDNYDSAASAVLTANNPDGNLGWDAIATAPDGSLGWWDKEGVEPLGHIWMWAADDTPDLAAYGLVPAQLCTDSATAANAATTCLSPTTASVSAAVAAATPDSSGLLEVNPASPGAGGYPLTQIIYAAVDINQSATALTECANLISYAAQAGQTTGTTPGDLPPGYLPLPSNLVTQAMTVVSKLQNLVSPSPSPSPSSSSSSSSFSSSAQAQNTGTTAASQTTATSTSTSAATVTSAATPTPAPAAAATTATQAPGASSSLAKAPVTSSSPYRAVALSSPTTPGPVISLPQAQVAAGTTPQQAVGAFRWVLIGVALVGGGFAGGGTLLRSGGQLLLWRRRRLL